MNKKQRKIRRSSKKRGAAKLTPLRKRAEDKRRALTPPTDAADDSDVFERE